MACSSGGVSLTLCQGVRPERARSHDYFLTHSTGPQEWHRSTSPGPLVVGTPVAHWRSPPSPLLPRSTGAVLWQPTQIRTLAPRLSVRGAISTLDADSWSRTWGGGSEGVSSASFQPVMEGHWRWPGPGPSGPCWRGPRPGRSSLGGESASGFAQVLLSGSVQSASSRVRVTLPARVTPIAGSVLSQSARSYSQAHSQVSAVIGSAPHRSPEGRWRSVPSPVLEARRLDADAGDASCGCGRPDEILPLPSARMAEVAPDILAPSGSEDLSIRSTSADSETSKQAKAAAGETWPKPPPWAAKVPQPPDEAWLRFLASSQECEVLRRLHAELRAEKEDLRRRLEEATLESQLQRERCEAALRSLAASERQNEALLRHLAGTTLLVCQPEAELQAGEEVLQDRKEGILQSVPEKLGDGHEKVRVPGWALSQGRR